MLILEYSNTQELEYWERIVLLNLYKSRNVEILIIYIEDNLAARTLALRQSQPREHLEIIVVEIASPHPLFPHRNIHLALNSIRRYGSSQPSAGSRLYKL